MEGSTTETNGDNDKQPQAPPKPRDGPATAFEVDTMFSGMFTSPGGDYFGLVLVTNWPASPLSDMDGPYQEFLGAIKSCFRDEDIQPSSEGSMPAVYMYQTYHLHITLATFNPVTKLAGDDKDAENDLQEAQRKQALKLVRSASKLPGWPTEPLKLVVKSGQIGKRAGILLWEDLSGGVDAIRNCLREATASSGASIHGIPGIIHTTFLRFLDVPQTPGEEVQEAFQSKIAGKLGNEFFATADESTPLLEAKTVRLVCELKPYVFFDDDDHVLWTSELTP
jgi:hypothetical protein